MTTADEVLKLFELEERARLRDRVGTELFQDKYGLRALIEESNRHQERIRALLGPWEDLKHAGLFDAVNAQAEMMRLGVADLTAQFRLPEILETRRLVEEAQTTGFLAAIREEAAALQQAIEGMRTPWLDLRNPMESVAGLAGLQQIGAAFSRFSAFDDELAESVRLGLGDWRKTMAWPEDIFTDPLARTSFYAERGLDPWLTNFPAEAFEQSLSIAGLRDLSPPLVDAYDGGASAEGDDEEAGFGRTNAAHGRLQRFETHLRRFIDESMTAAFGSSWIKHQVPGDIRRQWIEKKQTARENGEPDRPLIAYADFTDYVTIITRRDNWAQVFEPVFQRPESVRESFQRLFPIRVCTMHSRIITQDDELYLYVEVKRILGAIGVSI